MNDGFRPGFGHRDNPLIHRGAKARWTNLGSCTVPGSVCEWTIELAIRPEAGGLWSVRWRGEEQPAEILGPDHLDALAEMLVEDRGLGRDDVLDLLESCGVETVEEFARLNRTET